MAWKIAYPMYHFPALAAAHKLWLAGLARHLQEALGEAVTALTPDQLAGHWESPQLLLSQACGYPLRHDLQDTVRVVGCFRYGLPSGAFYHSVIIAAKGHARPADIDSWLGHHRLCINGFDSQSGWNALYGRPGLRAYLPTLAKTATISGAHKQSVAMVAHGEADWAAIDCVTLALMQRHNIKPIQDIMIIGFTPATPGLPLITAARNAPLLPKIRTAIDHALTDHNLTGARKVFCISGFAHMTCAHYREHPLFAKMPISA
ncbi:MAG: PhnD/SsuA/transferrin family substrate-binding protein [Pseudomonadota bacterium]